MPADDTTNLIIQRYGLPVPKVYPVAGEPINAGPPVVAPSPAPGQAVVAQPSGKP